MPTEECVATNDNEDTDRLAMAAEECVPTDGNEDTNTLATATEEYLPTNGNEERNRSMFKLCHSYIHIVKAHYINY